MADIQDITEKVKGIIVKQLAVNPDQVTPEARFIEDLNADSLDTVELVMEFEETFELKISDDVVENMLTVGAAIDYIAKKLDEKAAACHPKADHWLRHYVGTLTNVRPPDSVAYYSFSS